MASMQNPIMNGRVGRCGFATPALLPALKVQVETYSNLRLLHGRTARLEIQRSSMHMDLREVIWP